MYIFLLNTQLENRDQKTIKYTLFFKTFLSLFFNVLILILSFLLVFQNDKILMCLIFCSA